MWRRRALTPREGETGRGRPVSRRGCWRRRALTPREGGTGTRASRLQKRDAGDGVPSRREKEETGRGASRLQKRDVGDGVPSRREKEDAGRGRPVSRRGCWRRRALTPRKGGNGTRASRLQKGMLETACPHAACSTPRDGGVPSPASSEPFWRRRALTPRAPLRGTRASRLQKRMLETACPHAAIAPLRGTRASRLQLHQTSFWRRRAPTPLAPLCGTRASRLQLHHHVFLETACPHAAGGFLRAARGSGRRGSGGTSRTRRGCDGRRSG
jgi:hypothetical protein